MKTKMFFAVSFVLLPAWVFGQNMFDDLYSGRNTPLQTQQTQVQQQSQGTTTNTTGTTSQAQNDNQFKIESTRVGDRDVVVVRNMEGDTVYYSGDNNNQPAVAQAEDTDAQNVPS